MYASCISVGLGLSACTGTTEDPPALRIAVMTEKGSKLSYFATDDLRYQFEKTIEVKNAISLKSGENGNRLILTKKDGVQILDKNLGVVVEFANLPFTSCITQSALNYNSGQLLILNECPNTAQQLALYNLNGILLWSTNLPLVTALDGNDLPPTRIAMLKNTAIVSRAALGGGSEIIRVTQGSGTSATASEPQGTTSIFDLLTVSYSTVYAATSNGVQPLLDTGLPDTTKTVFGFTTKYDRLWSNKTKGNNIIAAWNKEGRLSIANRNLSNIEAKLMDSQIYKLQDITFTNDNYMYYIGQTSNTSSSSLIRRADMDLGFQNNSWNITTLRDDLNSATSLAWSLDQE